MQWIVVLLIHQNNKGIQIALNRTKTILNFTREKKHKQYYSPYRKKRYGLFRRCIKSALSTSLENQVYKQMIYNTKF